MKKYALLLMFGGTIALTSCGGEEATVDENATNVENSSNDMMNNAMDQGLDQAINEVTKQLKDSTSKLNELMDTMKTVIEDNQELIDEKVNEGLDALNKSMK